MLAPLLKVWRMFAAKLREHGSNSKGIRSHTPGNRRSKNRNLKALHDVVGFESQDELGQIVPELPQQQTAKRRSSRPVASSDAWLPLLSMMPAYSTSKNSPKRCTGVSSLARPSKPR